LTNEIVEFDLETKGLLPLKCHDVIEIGTVRIVDGEIEDIFRNIIDAGRPLRKRAYRINGITNAMQRGGPSPGEAFRNFRAFYDQVNLMAK